MKFQYLFLLVTVALCGVCQAEPTNSFAIYLTRESVDARTMTQGKGDWSHIRLSESPLISTADIVSYDFANHSIQLTPEAIARIPRPPVKGTAFVVVANDERIYLGVFTTSLSSMSFAVPSITVDGPPLATNSAPNTLVIEQAYPQPSFGIGTDPRGDPRIKTALAALHKLKSQK